MKIKTLKVVPNPYSALDADGRPQAVVSMEGQFDRYVGAVLNVEESQKTGKHIFDIDTSTAVEVPATPYYLRRLWAGTLVAADQATAKLAGLDTDKFEQPEVVVSKARELAAHNFEEEHGQPPAFATQPKKSA